MINNLISSNQNRFNFSLKEIKLKFANTFCPRVIFKCQRRRDKLNRRRCSKVLHHSNTEQKIIFKRDSRYCHCDQQ